MPKFSGSLDEIHLIMLNGDFPLKMPTSMINLITSKIHSSTLTQWISPRRDRVGANAFSPIISPLRIITYGDINSLLRGK